MEDCDETFGVVRDFVVMRNRGLGVETSIRPITQKAKQKSSQSMEQTSGPIEYFLNVYSILMSFVVEHSMYKTLLSEH
jgi:hypothetical protein